MIVACGTSGSEAEPDGGSCFHLILCINSEVFLVDCAAFAGRGQAAVESRGYDLIEAWVGKEVAGDLLDSKVFERLVLPEGLNDPISVGPDRAVVVDVDSVSVGIAGGIEPVT